MKGLAVKLFGAVKGFCKKVGFARAVAIVVCVAVISVAGNWVAALAYFPAHTFSENHGQGLAESLGKIKNDSGEVLAAQKDGLSLFLDTATLNIRIVDDATGKQMNTLIFNEALPERVKSPIVISFRDSKGQASEWDAYKFSISSGKYELDKIENGVRFSLTLSQDDSYAVGDYLPQKLSKKRYEEKFIKGLEALEAEGKAEDVAGYKKILSMFYRFDDEENCYYMAYTNTPPRSIMLILINMVKAIGYTQEDIIKDSEEFNLPVEFSNSAEYTIYLEHTIEDGAFVVNIPSYEIDCNNPSAYTLENIVLYPAFAGADETSNEGYLFIPDGSGMIMKMDSAGAVYSDYRRPLYNNTRYGDIYNDPHYGEDFTMPCFGLYYTGGAAQGSGFFSIIESGAENSYVNSTLKHTDANFEGGNLYNAVYPSFNIVQSANVKVFGAYAKQSAQYRVVTDAIDTDYKVRYYPLFEDADYYSFSKVYKDYLLSDKDITLEYDNTPKIFVNLLGAISVKASAMGVTYEKVVPMTTYKQALEIYDDMADTNVVYNYKWALNGGYASGYGGNADTVTKLGSKKDLTELLARSANDDNKIFLEANLLRYYRQDGLISTKQALVGFNGEAQEISDKYYPDGTMNRERAYNNYYLLHPKYLPKTVERFIKNSSWFDSVTLTDFGNTYYASYGKSGAVSAGKVTRQVVFPALDEINRVKNVALHNPNGDKIVYCDYAVGVSRESSKYGSYYASVPFRHLVMNGITAYTTLNVNMGQSSPRYFMLQAAELGSIPQYTVAAQKVDELIKAGVSEYYSVTYSDIKDDIQSFYEEYKNLRAEIGSAKITDHNILSKNLFETVYEGNVRVIVNYNLYEVVVDGITIDQQSYYIVKG